MRGSRSFPSPFLVPFALLVMTFLFATLPAEDSAAASSAAAGGPERLRVEILAVHPHDPTAFTQGLLFAAGELYESTGLYGKSTVRRTDAESGRVLQRRELDPGYFGEGLAAVGDALYQLTWKAGVVLVWDRETLEPLDEHGYNGQGWGLTSDGECLYMSDGSSRLTVRSAEDFRWLSTLEVTLGGEPVERLNELEWVDGRIYANLLGEEVIVRIDPQSGAVDGIVDASGLLTPQERRMVDVLNGVAYHPERDSFWLTGKFWPRMYEVRFVPVN